MCSALSTLLVCPVPARAQDTAPVVTAPQPLAVATARYPEAARQLGLSASVLLELTVDATGAVTEAEVVEPRGHGFDEAAREALLRSRFRPATRGGDPMPARILYRYSFALPAPDAVELPHASEPEPTREPPPDQAPEARPVDRAASSKVAEVHVRGQLTERELLEQSAEAVTVFDAERARRESSPLGEVLSRVPGVSIRRAGGLGSEERLSLNGLSDDRIPTFLDGVPLDLAFFPFGLSSFPVSLVDRVEIYKGIVPIRFGIDALGGAVNLVADHRYETGAGATYTIGSFGTHRLSATGAYRDEASNLVANATAFYDYADNDYEVDVQVPDDRGRLQPATVPRFHDAYEAAGATVEVGYVELPWAERLLLRMFSVALDKELQHNLVMSVPYGEVRYGQTATGATARYEQPLSEQLELELLASYSYRTSELQDKSQWVYDWFGNRVRERRVFGEIEADPTDQAFRWHNLFGRAVVEYAVAPQHVVTLASSPTWSTLTGDERLQDDVTARDPLTAKRIRMTAVTGLEYQANFFAMPDAPAHSEAKSAGTDHRLQNILFVKHYHYSIDSEEPLPGGVFSERDKTSNTFGLGEGIRYRFARFLWIKAGYEYATRLPASDEVFGDGMLIQDNLELEPELSHNANIGPVLDLEDTWTGDYLLEVLGFWRETDQLIVLLGNDRYFTYQNVWSARSIGVDVTSSWVSPGEHVQLEASTSVQDFRNVSDEGTFGDFEGDRIPNRPWLFASWGARLHFEDVALEKDELEPFYYGRYVHDYFRGWESAGLREYKQTVDEQLIHTVGLTYVLDTDWSTWTATFEVQNLFDQKAYDFWGVQKPGRGYYLTLAADIR